MMIAQYNLRCVVDGVMFLMVPNSDCIFFSAPESRVGLVRSPIQVYIMGTDRFIGDGFPSFT